ncbi:uncharacterized protein BN660_01846 [Clostridium sp. CAG:448]|nr:uncharacterized protein BN660_01846 [Clostridium sp. CAG:448]
MFITDKFGLGECRKQILGHIRPATDVAACVSCALALFCHQFGKARIVNVQSALCRNLPGQVNRETERIIQFESILAADYGFAIRDTTVHDAGKNGKSRIDGRIETLFLQGQHLQNIVVLFRKLRISTPVFTHGNLAQFAEERTVDAEQLSVAAGTADNPAQNIAAPLIGRNYTVANHEHGALDMVGAYTDGNIVFLVFTVGLTGNFTDLVQNTAVGINQEHIVHALHHTGKPLQTHTGIDVFLCKFGIVPLPVVIELGEHVVPDLHVTVAVATGAAIRLSATVFFAAVKIDFGTGTAGTGTVFPEIIFLPESGDTLGRNADLFGPDSERLFVILVDRGPEFVRRNLQRFGQKFPCPRDCLLFEIIPKRKISEHFKKGSVTCGVADAIQVRRADALLAGGNTTARRLLFAGKILFHGCHARIDQKQGFVIVRDQRKRGQAQVPLGFKE